MSGLSGSRGQAVMVLSEKRCQVCLEAGVRLSNAKLYCAVLPRDPTHAQVKCSLTRVRVRFGICFCRESGHARRSRGWTFSDF